MLILRHGSFRYCFEVASRRGLAFRGLASSHTETSTLVPDTRAHARTHTHTHTFTHNTQARCVEEEEEQEESVIVTVIKDLTK